MSIAPPKSVVRDLIGLAVVGLFAFAYVLNPGDEMMKTALVSALSVVLGFYLGGALRQADAKPQPVTVENAASDPVPVEPAR